MAKLTPEQIEERRQAYLNSPQYKLQNLNMQLQTARKNLAALDYKNLKYQEYEAVGKLAELDYTLADIYALKQPLRDQINALEAERTPLIEALRAEWQARQEAQSENK